jgi:uncharacterized protein (TIGR03435 family)
MTKHITAALLALFVCGEARSQQLDQPLTFEVASVKPTPPMQPGESRGRTGCFQGSKIRFVCARASVSEMARYAYDLKPYELRPPFSTDTIEFNIEAKLPSGTTAEQIPVMLRSLLSERFKLAFHREKAEVKGYTLLEAKGGVKMKESAPDAPVSGAVRPLAEPVKDPDGFVYVPGVRNTLVVGSSNGLLRYVGTSVPVSSLTGLLYSLTGLLPVLDATGLKGKYDFRLTFSQDSMGASGATALPGGDGALSSADVGPTLFQALDEQLGLKLEPGKIVVNLFVIDHAEKNPGEN